MVVGVDERATDVVEDGVDPRRVSGVEPIDQVGEPQLGVDVRSGRVARSRIHVTSVASRRGRCGAQVARFGTVVGGSAGRHLEHEHGERSAVERMIAQAMTAGAKHPTPFPFRSLTDDEFDVLVYLLAQVDDPKVARLRAPDGGLDTVRPSDTDPLVAGWGIQAKLHREHIKWPNCKQSLDRAVSIWGATRVTFAFPRDLTKNHHQLFHKHLSRRHPGITVDCWGESKLTGLLLASPVGRGIAKRFFHAEDPADLVDRALRAGGPPRTAADLLDRETVTAEFLSRADPHFDWVSTKRMKRPLHGATLIAANHDEANAMILVAYDGSPTHRRRSTAWRSSHPVPRRPC